MTRIADDFPAIAARLRELQGLPAPEPADEVCARCDGGGWRLSSYQAAGAPNFEECPACGNPEDHPCP